MASVSQPPITTSTTLSPNPTIPAYADDREWIASYMYVHMMSSESRRYIYFLWVAVLLLSLAFAFLHNTGSKGSFIGAYWSKWTLRRRTWRYGLSRNPQPVILQSTGQLLSLTLLTSATLALTLIGPDYIAPGTNFWEFYKHNSPPIASRGGTLDQSLVYPYVLQYTVSKTWWTSGGRNGLIAFALLPLCILFALKAPPFAIFALPFTLQLHSDKLAWLHRSSGRLIWFITLCHVVLWSVQLIKDQRPGTGNNALHYAWKHSKFIFGWIAFILLTLIVVLSLQPVRKRFYEAFYILHIFMVPLMLITAALHHPPMWGFCWVALGIWVVERIWRSIRWLRCNGFLGAISAIAIPGSRKTTMESNFSKEDPEENSPLTDMPQSYPPSVHPATVSSHKSLPSLLISSQAGDSPVGIRSSDPYARHSIDQTENPSARSLSPPSPTYLSSAIQAYIPPPGYCHAELLSGSTVRLRFVAPGPLSWAPGQYFLITIPSISKFTSHPFTTASIYDEQAPTTAGRMLVFLVRAKNGWTKQLWDRVANLSTLGQSHPPGERLPRGTDVPAIGVLFRMYVDGPFGSAGRARWGQHSSVVIVSGGSGVSFGLSVLRFVCLCMKGRDGRSLGSSTVGWDHNFFSTTRIRFVWLIREYAHIQWCASAIRRCMSIIPTPGLEVNIFVTHHKSLYDAYVPPPPRLSLNLGSDADEFFRLIPPTASFTRPHSESPNPDSFVDVSYFTSQYGDEERNIGDTNLLSQNYILDLTNFDGDNDATLPGEESLNRRVMKAGKHRRQKSRTAKALGSADQDGKPDEERRGRPLHQAHRLSQQPALRPSSATTRHSDYRRFNLSESCVVNTKLDNTNQSAFHESSEAPSHKPPSCHSSGSSLLPVSDTRPKSFSGLSEYDDVRHSRAPSPFSQDWEAMSATSRGPLIGKGVRGDDIKFQIDEQELRDVGIVSEHARPGKPKIDRILAYEVERSEGSTIVACCGPASLNAMVRKSIATQIDPEKIRRGDLSGFVAMISEDFSF